MRHIAVLMGGLSPESEVSEMSGKSVIAALKELGEKFTVINPTRNLAEQLRAVNPDVVFNALHGNYGEDGAIPGVLEAMNIPYTHSGILASAIAFNKQMTKDVVSVKGVRTPKAIYLSKEELVKMLESGKEPMARPFVIKPNQQGSSIGVYIVKEDSEFSFDAKSWNYGDIIVEEYIAGKEISTVVFNDKALGVLELRPTVDFYDFNAKYTDGVTEHIYPAEIPDFAYQQALDFAQIAHRALGCRTMSRSDLRFDPARGEEGMFFLEINTHPGFTHLSIVPDIAARHGYQFKDLVVQLLKDAKCEIVC